MLPSQPNTFEAQLPIVLRFDDFKDDRAPGENFATSYGVTEMSWAEAINDGLVPNKPISEATRDECIGIIRANYYNRCRISSLPAGAGLMVFNDAVLTGSGHAAKLFQRIVGANADGSIGSQTLACASNFAARFGLKTLIDKLHDADDEYLEALANAPNNIRGWERREDFVRDSAYRIAGISLPT